MSTRPPSVGMAMARLGMAAVRVALAVAEVELVAAEAASARSSLHTCVVQDIEPTGQHRNNNNRAWQPRIDSRTTHRKPMVEARSYPPSIRIKLPWHAAGMTFVGLPPFGQFTLQ